MFVQNHLFNTVVLRPMNLIDTFYFFCVVFRVQVEVLVIPSKLDNVEPGAPTLDSGTLSSTGCSIERR